MTRTTWLNIANCAKQRRLAEGLYGHWSHQDLPRYQELMLTEYTAYLAASRAAA